MIAGLGDRLASHLYPRDSPSFAPLFAPLFAHNQGLSFCLAARNWSAMGDRCLCWQHLVDSAKMYALDSLRLPVHYPVVAEIYPNL
ncbi:MAG: hypothetical protein EA001_10860 [Oscillatoriales cyanobacterium]|nr:MAG: hypothetical protein EA001_10860 [Oscillatoriales cyanobacterium]